MRRMAGERSQIGAKVAARSDDPGPLDRAFLLKWQPPVEATRRCCPDGALAGKLAEPGRNLECLTFLSLFSVHNRWGASFLICFELCRGSGDNRRAAMKATK